MSAMLVAESETVADRYRLDVEVGRGGSGVVWAATDLLLGRKVAVKHVVAAPGAGDGELRNRTLDEARASAAVQSPHVVPVYDVVEDGGALWVVMELLEARSLEEVVAREGALPPERVAAIGLAVLEGLEAVHAAGLLHRDVKPGNVLLGEDGRVLLTDFGIATRGDPVGVDGAGGLVVGSPAYLAPERTRGARGGRAADLWGLGATLATAVEGRAVFQREGAVPTLLAVLHDEPALEYAGPLASVLRGLLEKDPELRWDAVRARGELERVRSGAPRAPRGERAGRLALPGAALLVALVTAGLVAASPSGTPSDGGVTATRQPSSGGPTSSGSATAGSATAGSATAGSGRAGGAAVVRTASSTSARSTSSASAPAERAVVGRAPATGSAPASASAGPASPGAAAATQQPRAASTGPGPGRTQPPGAAQGHAGGQGNGKGQGKEHGKGRGGNSAHGNGQGQGNGHGQRNGQGHGKHAG